MASFPFVVSMVDAYGRPIVKRYVLSAADYDAALIVSATFVSALEGITGAKLTKALLSTELSINDVVTAGANRDAGATFRVRTTDQGVAVVKVPAPIASIFQSDGTVLLSNALVTAYFAPYLAGSVLVDDGETVTELISGVLDK